MQIDTLYHNILWLSSSNFYILWFFVAAFKNDVSDFNSGTSRFDIAETLKISEAAVSNKFYRDSFSAEDLIKIA